jgi:2-polyprenyl-3-methyl-5-hydroxy-6-metoxy-1,4-benzoquinol methylase
MIMEIPKTKQYIFEEVIVCEMCGSPASGHKLMGQRLNQTQGLRPKTKDGISVSVKRCTNCNLVYSSPQPVPFNIQDHYGIPPENYWSSAYFQWSENYFAPQIQALKNLMEIKPGMKALDVGAGIGKGILSLNNAGFDTYGLEPSLPFYERAISKMKIHPDKLKLGMIEDVDYEEHQFDFITFGAVMEHLYHPAVIVKKAMTWLKPGGIIHAEVPSSRWLIARLINFYYRMIGTNYVTNISPMHEPFHLYEFDLKSFQKLGERIGFEIALHEYMVCTIRNIPKPFHFIFRKYMERTNTGLQLTVWLKKVTEKK